MIKSPTVSFDESAELLVKALGANDVANISRVLKPLDVTETLEVLGVGRNDRECRERKTHAATGLLAILRLAAPAP